MRYTIEEIRQMPEGQTFDCKSIHIELIAVGISDKTRRIEGVDRMCRELSAIGTKEPQYHLVAFIMKASVWANVLEEGQEISQITTSTEQENETTGQEKGKKRARKGQEKLLALIKANPHISVSSIAKECGMSIKTIRNLIDELREDKLLERIGPAKGGYWKVLSEETSG